MAAATGVFVWCGADAISELDYASRKYPGLSRFNYELTDNEADVMADALETIGEHHPGETVWIERMQPKQAQA
ncbi:hypothetical protein C7T35_40435 [Variovorax sp. WS11]|nr:hypothetical protein [Variovorax sp. WS11]NDZ15404.1 hypothetical protein [Variovorax sp. WS11]PSL78905.1 hypothetical protein C7T35_40435 [Variovorax sp. WS11]